MNVQLILLFAQVRGNAKPGSDSVSNHVCWPEKKKSSLATFPQNNTEVYFQPTNKDLMTMSYTCKYFFNLPAKQVSLAFLTLEER